MNSKGKGDIAVMHVMLWLQEHGYTVLTPFGDNDRYDLVSEKNGVFTRIQVKYGAMRNGIIPVRLCSVSTKNGKACTKHYTPSEVDEVWVYCPNTGKLYTVVLDDTTPKNRLWLRVDKPTRWMPTMHRASDYERD